MDDGDVRRSAALGVPAAARRGSEIMGVEEAGTKADGGSVNVVELIRPPERRGMISVAHRGW